MELLTRMGRVIAAPARSAPGAIRPDQGRVTLALKLAILPTLVLLSVVSLYVLLRLMMRACVGPHADPAAVHREIALRSTRAYPAV